MGPSAPTRSGWRPSAGSESRSRRSRDGPCGPHGRRTRIDLPRARRGVPAESSARRHGPEYSGLDTPGRRPSRITDRRPPGTVPAGRCSRRPRMWVAVESDHRDRPRRSPHGPPSSSMPSDPGKVGPDFREVVRRRVDRLRANAGHPQRVPRPSSFLHLRSYCPAVPPRCRCTSCRLWDPSGRPGWTRPAETRRAWRTPPSASTRSGPPSPPAPSPSSSLTWLVGRTRPAPGTARWWRSRASTKAAVGGSRPYRCPMSVTLAAPDRRPGLVRVLESGLWRPTSQSGRRTRSCVETGDGQRAARAQTLPREGKRKPLLAGRDGAAAPDADDQRRGKRRAIGSAAGEASPPRSSVSSPPNSTTFG